MLISGQMLTLVGCYNPQPAAGTPKTLAGWLVLTLIDAIRIYTLLVVPSLLGQRGGTTLPGLILFVHDLTRP